MKANQIENFYELVDDAMRNASTDWDMEFTQDMEDRYKKFGGETFVSNAQLEQLERIANQ